MTLQEISFEVGGKKRGLGFFGPSKCSVPEAGTW